MKFRIIKSVSLFIFAFTVSLYKANMFLLLLSIVYAILHLTLLINRLTINKISSNLRDKELAEELGL